MNIHPKNSRHRPLRREEAAVSFTVARNKGLRFFFRLYDCGVEGIRQCCVAFILTTRAFASLSV
jgi:hypothetical protein